MKYILSIIIISALFSNTFAQKKEILYLKNGSVLEGRIVDSTGNKIKIETKGNCTWAFDKSEIEKLENHRTQNYSSTGFANFSTINLNFGRNDYSIRLSPSLTTINGFYFANKFYAGFGVGIEYFEYGGIPLFADLKYFINNKKVSPFIDFQGGWELPIVYNSYNFGNQRFGGINVGGEIGLINSISENFAFTCSFGYRYQEQKSKTDYWYWSETSNYESIRVSVFNSIFFKIGFIFG